MHLLNQLFMSVIRFLCSWWFLWIKMFTNKVSERCFLCFYKKKPEKTFHANSTLCPGSIEPLKDVIEDLARSAKLKLHLSEDTLLCLECCKIVATFIEKKRDLLDRIEKAMTYLDVGLDEEPIIKKESLSDVEISQDPFQTNIFEKEYDASASAKIPTCVDENFTNDEIKLSKHETNVNTCKKKGKKPLVIEKGIGEEQASSSEMKKTIAGENSSDDEMMSNEPISVMFTDEEVKKYKCDLCKFAHYDESHLILHKNTHKGYKETQCPFCLKLLSKKSHCIRHMEAHTNFEKYQCHKCGLRFTQSIKFNNHKMLHDAEENPLFCTICGRRFKTIKTLKTHAITHREDRPRYTCEYCGKIFVERYTRTVHLRTKHRKENQEKQDTQKMAKRQSITKQCTCIICKESFTNKEQLDSHMENEHDVILKTVALLPES